MNSCVERAYLLCEANISVCRNFHNGDGGVATFSSLPVSGVDPGHQTHFIGLYRGNSF